MKDMKSFNRLLLFVCKDLMANAKPSGLCLLVGIATVVQALQQDGGRLAFDKPSFQSLTAVVGHADTQHIDLVCSQRRDSLICFSVIVPF